MATSSPRHLEVLGSSVSPHWHSKIKPPNRSGRGRSFFRQLWWYFRERWKLLGFFEIDANHKYYKLTCMIKVGLRDALQDSIDQLPRYPLKDEDYTSVMIQSHEGFKMATLAGPVFVHLRHFLGLAERDYQNSLSSSACYLQFISNSKSKANFFLTNDKQFFLKTQNKHEIEFLLSKLELYIRHLHQYPHSLLVKFLGIHSIKVAQKEKRYFIIMKSIFYPDDRISERYDIKGCQVSRWTEPLSKDSQTIIVLKDRNFEGHTISLGSQRSWFIKQIELDTDFLCSHNILDYSFLVAFQELHLDEKGPRRSLLNLLSKSVDWVRGSAAPEAQIDSDSSFTSWSDRKAYNLAAHNCRLLPEVPNSLHILDGPEYRYFVGIVDLFTVYDLPKRVECLWKSLRHPGRSFSTVNPSQYARRLCHWVEDHTV